MKPRRLSDVARAVGGVMLGEDVEVGGVSIDSRLVEPGSLFVALPGARTDGARYVPDAFANGAAGVLVPHGLRVDGPAVWVDSTGEALMRLAADERARIDATVVGVAGANGKTSTKDMAAAVLRSHFRTHASQESFNNEVGLPLTLLGAPPDAEVIVAEIGARHVGDAAELCRIARPTTVVVTNVGVAHMEIFGSWERIVESSAEPIDAVEPDGVAILNADDPVVAGNASRCRGRVVTFGATARTADVRADRVVLGSDGLATFELVHRDERAAVELAVPGDHMVPNAIAAAAVGLTLGVDLPACAAALSAATISHWRMETFTTPEGVRVVNDAYNANPESMAAALKSARWMAGEGHLIAVLGAMAELGPIAPEAHERLGELAARVRVDRLIVVGEDARSIAAAAVREGVEPESAACYDDPQEALDDVRRTARPGDVVLVKASRVVGLERLAEALR
ncbi:MAG: UDP-N-acetylmuramoyl-tripeptide--D-alanyl-D-alanine ligase [Actinomycetota bacterium]|nr:UDP-N-acetylmuramoyl-tripeptide--D-alanyl-D-alanine ligase [Actinomycetota bacterium]